MYVHIRMHTYEGCTEGWPRVANLAVCLRVALILRSASKHLCVAIQPCVCVCVCVCPQYPKGSSVPEAGQPGLQLPSSFLSMDTDSRVLRIDTFSKLLGPG